MHRNKPGAARTPEAAAKAHYREESLRLRSDRSLQPATIAPSGNPRCGLGVTPRGIQTATARGITVPDPRCRRWRNASSNAMTVPNR
jgi:hypothetical protein